MNINLRYYQNGITNVNGNSSSAGAGYLDRVLSHELTHAAMAANIKDFIELPLFIKEGAAELVHGIDDERTSSILTMVNTGYKATATSNGVSTTLDMEGLLTKVFDLNNSGYKYSTYSYAGGYMLLRYLAKSVDDYVVTKGVAMSGASVSGYEAKSLTQLKNAELSFCESSCLSESFVDYSSNSFEFLKIFGNC